MSVLKVENVGEACPNGEPLKRAAGDGETADSQPRKEAFASITTEYSMSFRVLTASEFGRAQNYWTTGEGEGGETHREFSPPPPPSLNYFGLAKRITSMTASDILTYGAFDLRTCWTEIRR